MHWNVCMYKENLDWDEQGIQYEIRDFKKALPFPRILNV